MNVPGGIRFRAAPASGRRVCATLSALVLSVSGLSAQADAPRAAAGGDSFCPCLPSHAWQSTSLTLPDGIPSPISHKDTLTVRFIGDVMLHSRQMEAARRADGTFDFSSFLSGIGDSLAEADIAVAGMEFTLAGPPYTGYPSFSAPDSYAEYMADCGVDVFLTANNHILDKGARGLERTLLRYDDMEEAAKIRYTGCAAPGDTSRNPLILLAKGIRLAIVNCTYGTNSGGEAPGGARVMRMDAAEPMIARARTRGADFVIVCPHWGEEYSLLHSRGQEALAVRMAECGADMVVGAHPHVVQDRAELTASDGRRVPVYYSLGNAVSNMSARDTQLGLMLELRLTRDELGNVSMLGVSHRWTWCSRPGELTQGYRVVFTDNCPPRDAWRSPAAYRKMSSTLARVSTGW